MVELNLFPFVDNHHARVTIFMFTGRSVASNLSCSQIRTFWKLPSGQFAPNLHHRPLRINHNLRPVVVNHRPRPVYHPLIPLNLRHNLPLYLQRRQGDLYISTLIWKLSLKL